MAAAAMMAIGEKVGFWRRVGAYIVDGVVLFVLFAVVGSGTSGDPSAANGLGLLIDVVYFVGLWTYWNGQTLGNKLLGIRVVKTDGSPVNLVTALVRYVGVILAAIPLLIGLIWVAFDREKQGWHDKIAGTYVVRA